MSVTLTVSDKAFQRLQLSAKKQGKQNVEEMLEEWPISETMISNEKLVSRKELGKRIHKIQKRLSDKYGLMPDSTTLVREDRKR